MQKDRKLLVYLEVDIRIAYLCRGFRIKGAENQQISFCQRLYRQCFGEKPLLNNSPG